MKQVTFAAAVTLTVALGVQSPSVRGVVLSNHVGQGAHASGEVTLATMGGIRSFDYGEPLATHFVSNLCLDIGAIWTVEWHSLPDGSRVVNGARCEGAVDQSVHEAWLLVREYLDEVNSLKAGRFFSAGWRSSAEYREYANRTAELSLADYSRFGRDGRCMDVTSIESSDRAHVRVGADCYVRIGGKPVTFYSLFNATERGGKSSASG